MEQGGEKLRRIHISVKVEHLAFLQKEYPNIGYSVALRRMLTAHISSVRRKRALQGENILEEGDMKKVMEESRNG